MTTKLVEDAKKKVFSVEEMLSVDDTKYVEVPWGPNGVIRLGSLSIGAMLDFTEANESPKGRKTAGLRILLDSLVDAAGNRIGNYNMIESFRKKDAAQINKVVAAISELNGFGDKPLDFQDRITKAEFDAAQLAEIADEMRTTAGALLAAEGDKKKILAILAGKREEEAKND